MSRSRSRLDHFRRSEQLDTSPQHIDRMYDSWCEGEDGVLWESVLRERLKVDCNIFLSEEFLSAALKRVRERFHDDGSCADGRVPRIVFASLWQRLILGFVCRPVGEPENPSGEGAGIRLVEYTERDSLKDRTVSENAFLFGGHERNRDTTSTCGRLARGPTSRWAWIETSRNDLLMKMGVKFFLHPVATEDLMHAAQKGTTKIDRYRHQYFVALELYALDAAMLPDTATPEKVSAGGDAARCQEQHGEVGPRITRSTMSLLATGNPPTRAKPSSARDWLLSVVNDADQQSRADRDPLDRFSSDQTAARKVLQSVLGDLRAHKRQREYQADFLLYSIIDRAAGELTPIYNAYGRRLRWLQDRLDAGKLGTPKAYVDEVSRVRLELQELRQWVGQIKGIILHLECDCRSSTGGATEQGPWNFGADARGQGKSVLVFLRHTQDYLEQAADRLSVLEDLGRTFVAATERNKSDFMNQTLFVLTIATATFLPAQFLAGVYGMNFVDSEGRPSMPELTSRYGYPIFWGLVVCFFLTGVVLSCCCLRCKAPRVRCPKGAAPRCRAAGPGTTKATAPKQVN